MVETRDIIFLGGSYAGLSGTHYFLKHVYPSLPVSSDIAYKVVLINASSKFFQKHASPRAIANPSRMPNEKLFLAIEPGFEQYGDKFQFVAAKATSWDPKNRQLYLMDNAGQTFSMTYYALVLATGSKTSSLAQSSHGNSHEEIESALATVSHEVKNARSIVIAGGGPAGVETAGEIGEFLNGSPGWFQARNPKPRASITLITSSNKLLPCLRSTIAKQAEMDLQRLGVRVRYNTRVLGTPSYTNHNKTVKVTLDDGSEISADLYLPTIGVTPLNAFIPTYLLDSKGRVLANERTLRVHSKAGPRVYAIGDIASFTSGSISEIQLEVPVLASNMKLDLLATDSGEEMEFLARSEDRIYIPEHRELQIVPIGRTGGVGALWGWRIPSFLVWLIKGRDFMVSSGIDRVYGKPEIKES